MPTLLDIYDALYAKLSDGAAPPGVDSADHANPDEPCADGVPHRATVNSPANTADKELSKQESSLQDTDRKPGLSKKFNTGEPQETDDIAKYELNTKIINFGTLDLDTERTCDHESEGSCLPSSTDNISNLNNSCNIKSRRTNLIARHFSRENSYENELESFSCRNLCEYCLRSPAVGNKSYATPSAFGAKCLCSDNAVRTKLGDHCPAGLSLKAFPANSDVLPPGELPPNDSVRFNATGKLLADLSHPNLSQIPPRSPRDTCRKFSQTTSTPNSSHINMNPNNTSNLGSNCSNTLSKPSIYRPLSSISSSSSSSSNSLPRNVTMVNNTSYLASVESLVENDSNCGGKCKNDRNCRGRNCGGNGGGGGGQSARRRERSLKIRRDLRGQLSRPGELICVV